MQQQQHHHHHRRQRRRRGSSLVSVAMATLVIVTIGATHAFLLPPASTAPTTGLVGRRSPLRYQKASALAAATDGGGGGGWDDEEDVRFSMGSKHIDTGFLKVGSSVSCSVNSCGTHTLTHACINNACSAKRRRRCGRTRGL